MNIKHEELWSKEGSLLHTPDNNKVIKPEQAWCTATYISHEG